MIKTIFWKQYKEISLVKLLKLTKPYFVIELLPDESLQTRHFVHAIPIYKFNLEALRTYVTKNDLLVLNADKEIARSYYKQIKMIGFKKVFIMK